MKCLYKKKLSFFIILLMITVALYCNNLLEFSNPQIQQRSDQVTNYLITEATYNTIESPSEQRVSNRLQERERMWNELELSCVNKTKYKLLPKIIGIGVEKCGTDALVQFLKPHPLIRLPKGSVETHYFSSKLTVEQGVTNYLNFFPEVEENVFLMEKSPSYFNFYSVYTPYQMKKKLPNVKLLLTLCDPVYRVLSDFVHEGVMQSKLGQKLGIKRFNTTDDYLNMYLPFIEEQIGDYDAAQSRTRKNRSFMLIDKDYLTHILTTGFYALHLKRWFKYFKKDEIMIIDAEEMMTDPGTVVENIQDFLKLPKVLLREDYVKDNETGFYAYKDWKAGNKLKKIPKGKQRTRNGHQHLSEKAIEKLQLFYKSHNEALFKMLNRTFLWS